MSTELTDLEIKTLRMIAEGYQDAAIAARECVQTTAISKRTGRIGEKLGIEGRGSDYNFRCRLVFIALSRGIIEVPA